MGRHPYKTVLMALAIAWAFAVPVALAQSGGAATGVEAKQPPPLEFTVSAFRVKGANPLDPARTDAVLAPFLGKYSGIEGLYEAANTLEQAIAESGHSFHRVVLPAQTLQEGTVVLEVVAFKLGEITVKGNQHFSRENILRSMPGLVPGEVPRTRLLAQQRYVANQHPSKKIELKLRESKTQLAIDAELAVEDQPPEALFLGINNTGNKATGHYRILGGFQHTNLTGHDDQLTISTTVSPSRISSVKQIGVSYAYPLYSLGGRLNAYYATSSVDSGTVQGVFDVAGAGDFWGVSYTHFLPRMGGYTHSLTVGVEDKRFDNSVSFLGIPIGVDVRTRPFTLSYDGSYEHPMGVSTFHLAYVRNIPTGARNTGVNYAGSRIGADPVWDALRFGATADVSLPGNWLLRWRGDGQLANEPLVSGEQFGVGGARSVRGYEEREVAGDKGFFTSVEAWTPPLLGDARAIAFADLGYRSNRAPQPGEEKANTLSAVGVGVRWYWKTSFSLELDVARTLNEASNLPGNTLTRAGDYKVHFNTFYRF